MSILNIQAKSKLAKLLARENILVIHKNVSTASFDGEDRILVLPNFVSDLSVDLYDMFVGHEVSHALNTPFVEFDTTYKQQLKEVPKEYWNPIEDVRVDRLIKQRYPGLAKPYANGTRELWDIGFYGVTEKDIPNLLLIDRINLQFKAGIYGIANIPFSPKEKVFVERASAARTFSDVLELAKDIYKYDQQSQSDDQQQNQDDQQSQSCDQQQDQQGQSDKQQDQQGQGQSDDQQDQQDDQQGQGQSDEQQDQQDDQQGQGQSDEQQDQQGQGQGQSDDQQDQQDDQQGQGQGQSDDQQDQDKQGQSDSDQQRDKQGHASDSKGRGGSKSTPENDVKVKSLGDYSDFFKKKTGSAPTLVMPKFKMEKTRHITNERYCQAINNCGKDMKKAAEFYEETLKKNRSLVNAMVRKFNMHKSADVRRRAAVSKTGMLNMNELHKYKTHDDIFLRTTVLPKGKNHGLFMLIDLSSSMTGKMREFYQRLEIVLSFAEQIGIPYEVWAFTDGGSVYSGNASGDAIRGYDSIGPGNRSFSLTCVLSNIGKSKSQVRKNKVGFLHNFVFHSSLSIDGRSVSFIGATPLAGSMIILPEFINSFKEKTQVDLTSLFVISDGDDNCALNGVTRYGATVIDRGISFKLSDNNNFIDIDTLAGWLKHRCGLHSATGFYINQSVPFTEFKTEFSKNRVVSVKKKCVGFDDYFFVDSIDRTSTVIEQATRQFSMGKNPTNHVDQLNRYVDTVSSASKPTKVMIEAFAKIIA